MLEFAERIVAFAAGIAIVIGTFLSAGLARFLGLAGELRYAFAAAGRDDHCPARALVIGSRAQALAPADTEDREVSSRRWRF
jgi:hypothetical protein